MPFRIDQVLPPVTIKAARPSRDGILRVQLKHAEALLELAVNIGKVVGETAGHGIDPLTGRIELQPIAIPISQEAAQAGEQIKALVEIFHQIEMLPAAVIDVSRYDRCV